MSTARATDKVTIPQLHSMRERGDRIAVVVAYAYPSGRLTDAAGMDVILVGDSLAMTMLRRSSAKEVCLRIVQGPRPWYPSLYPGAVAMV